VALCPLLAQSGHGDSAAECLFSGVQRTLTGSDGETAEQLSRDSPHLSPHASGTILDGLRLALGAVARSPHPLIPACSWGHGSPLSRSLAMRTERLASHHEAREALVLSIAGVTVIMLIESLILLILY
jgi:hypothetical protein